MALIFYRLFIRNQLISFGSFQDSICTKTGVSGLLFYSRYGKVNGYNPYQVRIKLSQQLSSVRSRYNAPRKAVDLDQFSFWKTTYRLGILYFNKSSLREES